VICTTPRLMTAPVSERLTLAERAVLEHLLAGLANKEIAAVLGKAEPTIKHQVSAILRKHHVPSRARLIVLLR
jgi:DNA-binding NarL/FixJ family response regulator